ncbi:hypothetical protein ACWFQ8_29915 [Streptomyces sp. NPDC055254]
MTEPKPHGPIDWANQQAEQRGQAQPARKLLDQMSDAELAALYGERDLAVSLLARVRETSAQLINNANARADKAEAERDKACTAFNAKVMELEQAKRQQLGDREAISYWSHQARLARDYSAHDGRALASTIVQARRWAARARTAEAALARGREVEEQWRMHFLATGEAAGGHALAMVRAALDEPQEPTP